MNYDNKQVVVRIPPSPTGEWHFGNIRTFIFNYLFAKKHNGKIVMRFEDTDTARNKPGADEQQLEILKRLKIDFDEGPFYQSQRKEIYKQELVRIINEGKAYEAEENTQGNGRVVRIKNSSRHVTWNDLVKGSISISTDSFKDEKGNPDFIIARSIDDPLYHFTVVVDDYKMNITHVLRGEDHVTSTPRHVVIFEALGAEVPNFGHFPTIIGENRKKLGKRNGAVPVREYLEKTYLPDAILNAIALLGWNPGGEQEIFTRDELIEKFSLERVQLHPAIFTGDKLDWINKEHIKLLNEIEVEKEILSRLPQEIKSLEKISLLINIIKEKISKWSDVDQIVTNRELDYFFNAPKISKENLLCPEKLRKGKEVSLENIKNHLENVEKKLEQISEEKWSGESVKGALWDYATEEGRGVVLWAMRYALSGLEKSPDPFTLGDILGKTETIKRIQTASAL